MVHSTEGNGNRKSVNVDAFPFFGTMRYDKKPDPFYKSAAWRRVRALALMRDNGICQDCLAAKRRGEVVKPRTATVVHHIVPVEQDPSRAMDLDNLISLCDACHNKRHPEKGAGDPKPEPPTGVRVIKI